jgi:hypothetical protein
MPTVPVRASCVPLVGQAAWIAALGSAVPDCGAVGCGGLRSGGLRSGVLTCAVCVEGGAGGRRRGASTVTAGNAGAVDCSCAAVPGDDDASGCVVRVSCAGAPGGDAEGTFWAGVLGDDDDGDSSDCVLPCSAGGVAWARTSLAPVAASAIVLTESSASFATALMQ